MSPRSERNTQESISAPGIAVTSLVQVLLAWKSGFSRGNSNALRWLGCCGAVLSYARMQQDLEAISPVMNIP